MSTFLLLKEDEASATSTVQDAQETSTLPKKKRGRPSKKDKQATNAAERTEKNGQEKTPLAEESERKRVSESLVPSDNCA